MESVKTVRPHEVFSRVFFPTCRAVHGCVILLLDSLRVEKVDTESSKTVSLLVSQGGE